MGMLGIAIYSVAVAFFFLSSAFYIMVSTSGATLIMLDNIHKIKLLNYAVVIFHKELGRIKKRYLVMKANQIDTMKNALLFEKMIEEKDIKINH
jgi:hypothetical protein